MRKRQARYNAKPERKAERLITDRAKRERDPAWAEAQRAYVRAWREAERQISRERFRIYSTKWRRNPSNHHHLLASKHRRRAREHGVEGHWTPQDIALILSEQGFKCCYCFADISAGHHNDHFIPLAQGGTNWADNIVATCESCNKAKGAKMPWEFLANRGGWYALQADQE